MKDGKILFYLHVLSKGYEGMSEQLSIMPIQSSAQEAHS